jgi:hypothetical protein
MIDSEDEDPTVDPKHISFSHKRQKTGNTQPTETHDDGASTARTESKIFRHLQEQRARLPIAQGGSTHKSISE